MDELEHPFSWGYPLGVAVLWAGLFVVFEYLFVEGNLVFAASIGFLGGLVFGVIYEYFRHR